MSRVQILEQCLTDERLFKVAPLPFPGDETVVLEDDDMPRKLYVSADVMAAIMPPFADTPEDRRLGEFRGWLDEFLLGSEISVCEDPDRKPPDTDFARVKPVQAEFWSIRVMEPRDTDGLRSIGAFHAQDEFIALRWQYREVIGDDFDGEVEEARAHWHDIFGDETPHKGETLNEYLTCCMAYVP